MVTKEQKKINKLEKRENILIGDIVKLKDELSASQNKVSDLDNELYCLKIKYDKVKEALEIAQRRDKAKYHVIDNLKDTLFEMKEESHRADIKLDKLKIVAQEKLILRGENNILRELNRLAVKQD